MGNSHVNDDQATDRVLSDIIEHLPSATVIAYQLTTLSPPALQEYITNMLDAIIQDNNALIDSLDRILTDDINLVTYIEIVDLSCKLNSIISYLKGFQHALSLSDDFTI